MPRQPSDPVSRARPLFFCRATLGGFSGDSGGRRPGPRGWHACQAAQSAPKSDIVPRRLAQDPRHALGTGLTPSERPSRWPLHGSGSGLVSPVAFRRDRVVKAPRASMVMHQLLPRPCSPPTRSRASPSFATQPEGSRDCSFSGEPRYGTPTLDCGRKFLFALATSACSGLVCLPVSTDPGSH